jgi:FkbM family methyltransferase
MNLAKLARRLVARIIPPPETPSRKYDRIFHALREGDVAVDCGANVGRFTEIMARNGATVYAFEPNPHAFRVLERRFSESANVHCINKAVFTRDAVLPLYLHVNEESDPVYWSTGSSLLELKTNVTKENFVTVEAIDLCRFIEDLDDRMPQLKEATDNMRALIKKNNHRNVDLGWI